MECNNALMESRPITLACWQKEAVENIKLGFKNGEGMAVKGKTGSGKTICAIRAIKEYQSNRKGGSYTVLVLLPHQGGNLALQWEDELRRDSNHENAKLCNTIVCSGNCRCQLFARWHEIRIQQQTNFKCGGSWCFVSFQTFHSESKMKDRSSLLADVAWDYVVVDECHFFKSATDFANEHQEIDPDKKIFSSVYTLLKKQHRQFKVWPLVVCLTATLVCKQAADIYPLLVLMNSQHRSKSGWVPKAEWSTFQEQKRLFLENHYVCIKVPPNVSQPEADRHHIHVATFSDVEVRGLIQCATHLKDRIKTLRAAFSNLAKHPHNLVYRSQVEEARRLFNAEFTRARRGSLHIAFASTSESTDVMENDKESGMARSHKNVPIEMCDKYPLLQCSKMRMLIEILNTVPGGRIIVTSQFSQPLDFLAYYIQKDPTLLPNGSTFDLHHGSIGPQKTKLAMTNFKKDMDALLQDTDGKALRILFATTGSIGEGIDLGMTTCYDGVVSAVRMFCLDEPLTDAELTQLRGRIKRVPKQSNVVHEWHYHVIRAVRMTPSGPIPFVDDALMKLRNEKMKIEASILMSEEELKNVDGGRSKDQWTYESNKGLMNILDEMCTPWYERSAKRKFGENVDAKNDAAHMCEKW